MISYRYGNDVDLDETIELYVDSTLGSRRPIDDRAIVRQMLDNANLVVTAWDDRLLVGIARSLTDFGYIAYLADLAVRLSYQRRGIGKELIRRTQAKLGARAMITLVASSSARDYYPHIGLIQYPDSFYLEPGGKLKG